MAEDEGEPLEEEMIEFLALPLIPSVSTEEKLHHTKETLHEGFECMANFDESLNTRIKEF